MKGRILIIDDDAAILQSCRIILEDCGYEVETAECPEQGLACLARQSFDAALIDFHMPGQNGLQTLAAATRADPDLVAIIFTADGSIEAAVEAVKQGAFNYLLKPFTAMQLSAAIDKAVEHRRARPKRMRLRQRLYSSDPAHEMVGESPALRRLLALAERVALSEANVLITGESGTGKELLACAIHAHSSRAQRPLVPVDCAALPLHLMESELFGFEKGAFTGADHAKHGLIELSEGGTLFLDEIGELNLEMQVKLLRALQERAFRRVGGERLIHVDIRLIASTNRDLSAEVQAGRFRQDLLYRLNVVTFCMPPLRERQGDVALLAHHYLKQFAHASGKPEICIAPDALAMLEGYPWPGNIRELRNVMERAVVLCDGEAVRPADLPDGICVAKTDGDLLREAPEGGYQAFCHASVESRGKSYFAELLQRHDGNIAAVAREAQVSRKTVYELLRRFGLERA